MSAYATIEIHTGGPQAAIGDTNRYMAVLTWKGYTFTGMGSTMRKSVLRAIRAARKA